MNRYEAILLDKMVDIWRDNRDAWDDRLDGAANKVFLLLDCICDFREPPRALDVEDGYGALVDSNGEVVA